MMNIRKLLLLTMTHTSVLAFGFAAGIYVLPIITAPPAPSDVEIKTSFVDAEYRTEFVRDLEGSDPLHWGQGEVSLSAKEVSLLGSLAPGPEYKLYLSPEFVETEAEFEQLKSQMKLVGDVKTFNNFKVNVSAETELSHYNTVVVWCEAFSQFITSAKYR